MEVNELVVFFMVASSIGLGFFLLIQGQKIDRLMQRVQSVLGELRETRARLNRLEAQFLTEQEDGVESSQQSPADWDSQDLDSPAPESPDRDSTEQVNRKQADSEFSPTTVTPAATPWTAAATSPAPDEQTSPPPPLPIPAAGDAPDRKPGRDRETIDWERWLGVRGAALVGGMGLALAGILFVRYAIDQGWVGPLARVLLTGGLGAVCLTLLGPIKRRGFEVLGEALGGAGSVMLYGAAWAAYRLYDLMPVMPALACMAATTALVVWLSDRYRSRVLVVFAAVGGFGTPLLLGTWNGNPIGLFGYALLLDLGLLTIARSRNWVWMEWVALAGTFLLHVLWAGLAAESQNAEIGLLAALGYVGLFAIATGRVASMAALISAFGLALLYTVRIELEVELWQLGIGIVPMTALLAWSSRRDPTAIMTLAGAGATAGLGLAWLLQEPLTLGRTWQFLGVLGASGIALAWLIDSKGEGKRRVSQRPELGVLLLAASLSIGLFAAARRTGVELDPWSTGVAGLISLGLGLAVSADRTALRALPILGVFAGLGLALVAGSSAALPAALLVALTLGYAVLQRGDHDGPKRKNAAGAAAALLVPVLWSLPTPLVIDSQVLHSHSGPALFLGLGALGLAAAVVGRSQLFHGAFALALAFAWLRWDIAMGSSRIHHALGTDNLPTALGLRLLLGLVLLAPILFRFKWWTTALAPALLWLPHFQAWSHLDRGAMAFVVPLGLGLVSLAGTTVAHYQSAGRAALARHGVVTWCLLTFAFACWLQWSWFPTGSAIAFTGGALIALHLEHSKLFRLCTLGSLAAYALLSLTALYHKDLPNSPWLISPFLFWSFLIPAFAGALLLARGRGQMTVSMRNSFGVAVTLVVFAWINLTVFDAYEPRSTIHRDFDRSQAQNLVQSLAWVVFALSLLSAGTWIRLDGLRWLSLGVLLAALAKVGLWDLGELTGLFRIASIAGLAIALLGVSVLYQRFVFRPVPAG